MTFPGSKYIRNAVATRASPQTRLRKLTQCSPNFLTGFGGRFRRRGENGREGRIWGKGKRWLERQKKRKRREQWRRQLWGTSPMTSKSESQLSKSCVVCEISWCRCQQLTALSISTAVTKLSVIDQLLHPALKSTMSAPWHNFNLCPSSQQILATPLEKRDGRKECMQTILFWLRQQLTHCKNYWHCWNTNWTV